MKSPLKKRRGRSGAPPPIDTVAFASPSKGGPPTTNIRGLSPLDTQDEPLDEANKAVQKTQKRRLWFVVAIYAVVLWGVGSFSLARHRRLEREAEEERLRQEQILLEEKKRNNRNIFHKAAGGVKKLFQMNRNGGGGGGGGRDGKDIENSSKNKSNNNKRRKPVVFVKSTTIPPKWSARDETLITELGMRTHSMVPNLDARVAKVGWSYAGSSNSAANALSQPWWNPATDGRDLLAAHYRIMKPSLIPDTLETKFPFSFCKTQVCPAEASLRHTLLWREIYQPWAVSQNELDENKNGFVYTRGIGKGKSSSDNNHSGGYQHGLVWVRPGHHRVQNGEAYFRAIFHTVDKAIAASRHHNLKYNANAPAAAVGKFNVIVDADQYEWSKLPDLGTIKIHLSMMQDHYPDRLGMIFLANMSRGAEFFANLIKKLLTQEVREKIVVLSNNPHERQHQLDAILEPDDVPVWLGGPADQKPFDAQAYYPPAIRQSVADCLAWQHKLPKFSAKK